MLRYPLKLEEMQKKQGNANLPDVVRDVGHHTPLVASPGRDARGRPSRRMWYPRWPRHRTPPHCSVLREARVLAWPML